MTQEVDAIDPLHELLANVVDVCRELFVLLGGLQAIVSQLDEGVTTTFGFVMSSFQPSPSCQMHTFIYVHFMLMLVCPPLRLNRIMTQ